jgi:hypothetical protein
MAKYDPLRNYLKNLSKTTNQITLTFTQINKILGNKLPTSSVKWFHFWDNQPGTGHSAAWLQAGWETIMVDMENEKVKFQRKARNS